MKFKTVSLVECAILIAIAFVLSILPILHMPMGGTVTIASMVPIMIAGYRHGFRMGLATGFVYAILQIISGLNNLSYATSIQAGVAIVLLDYIVPFTLLGFLGLFSKRKNQNVVLIFGTLILCVIRFVCHFISGCTVWAGLLIPDAKAAVYSLVYNAGYMIPETIITVYMIALLSNSLDFKSETLKVRPKSETVSIILTSVVVFGASIVAAFVYIFSLAMNEDGFVLKNISNANPAIIATIIGAGAAISVICFMIMTFVKRKKNSVKNI
ncbi:MAG: energy-coupled thiamine transporter ThiT [Eubacterium sp.]|nr:energy-coupled thiamine transporter ThiT [Eubacterium sp.]